MLATVTSVVSTATVQDTRSPVSVIESATVVETAAVILMTPAQKVRVDTIILACIASAAALNNARAQVSFTKLLS